MMSSWACETGTWTGGCAHDEGRDVQRNHQADAVPGEHSGPEPPGRGPREQEENVRDPIPSVGRPYGLQREPDEMVFVQGRRLLQREGVQDRLRVLGPQVAERAGVRSLLQHEHIGGSASWNEIVSEHGRGMPRRFLERRSGGRFACPWDRRVSRWRLRRSADGRRLLDRRNRLRTSSRSTSATGTGSIPWSRSRSKREPPRSLRRTDAGSTERRIIDRSERPA